MNRKRGFALAATIFALLLLGELVSWGLLVSLAEAREGNGEPGAGAGVRVG